LWEVLVDHDNPNPARTQKPHALQSAHDFLRQRAIIIDCPTNSNGIILSSLFNQSPHNCIHPVRRTQTVLADAQVPVLPSAFGYYIAFRGASDLIVNILLWNVAPPERFVLLIKSQPLRFQSKALTSDGNCVNAVVFARKVPRNGPETFLGYPCEEQGCSLLV